MTQHQLDARRCGLIPGEHEPEFFAKHLSAYHFLKLAARGKSILEVGFGDGYGMNYLLGTAARVTGVDIAPDNISLAGSKYPHQDLQFIHFDGYQLPFADNHFDMVCSFQVIEHIPEARLIEWLNEVRRVLKPGGAFYVSTLNLKNAQKPGCVYEKNVDHEKEFFAWELEALLRRVFPSTRMFGLHYSLKHHFFRRLKKLGLSRNSWIRSHFDSVTVNDFTILSERVDQSLDLIAICGK